MERLMNIQVLAALLVGAVLFDPTFVMAQASRGSSVGIVTTLAGEATVTRADRPAQAVPLKFKDELYFKDRISTKQNSIARVLMGGKSLVTVRELSELTITEEPGRPSILELFGGKIALAVAKLRMRPGESIEVRTPNAVAAVRGTVLVVEVTNEADSPAKPRLTSFHPGVTPVQSKNIQATFYNVSPSPGSLVDVSPLSGKTQAGNIVTLNPGQFVTSNIFGLGQPQNIPPNQMSNILSGLKGAPQNTKPPEQTTQQITQNQQAQALVLSNVLTPPPPPPPVTQGPIIIATSDCSGSGANSAACQPVVEAIQGDNNPPPSGVGNPGVPPQVVPLVLGPATLGPQTVPPPSTPLPGLPTITKGLLSGTFENNTGTTLVTCDDCTAIVNLPFTFPFLGRNYTAAEVSSNGFVTPLTDASSNELNGQGCCSPPTNGLLVGHQRIAAAWFDLLPGGGVQFTNNLPGRAVFTWLNVPEFPNQGSNTFQMQLFQDGRVIFLYNNLSINSHTSIVGVTQGGVFNPDGTLAFALPDPGQANFRAITTQQGTGAAGTVYQFFNAATFNLNGQFIIFAPNGLGGWDVLDPPLSSSLVSVSNGEVMVRDRPLLEATNESQLLIGGVALVDNGQLRVTDSRPLVSLIGETHSLGITPDSAIFDLRGSVTAVDSETGLELGTQQPLIHTGEMVRLDNAAVGAEQLVKLDRALLEASAPLLNMMNGSAMVSNTDLVNLTNHAKMTANLVPSDALIQLNASRLTVNHGSLFNVANSSSFTLNGGSLVSLANGSSLNILNGGLLSVSGGSFASITGSLFSFTGANNSVAINNSFGVTNTINGISFFQGPGATVNILPTAHLSTGTGTGTITGTGPLIIAQGAGTSVTVR